MLEAKFSQLAHVASRLPMLRAQIQTLTASSNEVTSLEAQVRSGGGRGLLSSYAINSKHVSNAQARFAGT